MYSMDLRERVVAALDQGVGITEVARRFQVGRATAREWERRRDKGRLEPDKPGPKGARKFTSADDALICHAIKQNPGVTATEIRPQLSQWVSIQSICNRMNKLGYRLKKSRSSQRSRLGST